MYCMDLYITTFGTDQPVMCIGPSFSIARSLLALKQENWHAELIQIEIKNGKWPLEKIIYKEKSQTSCPIELVGVSIQMNLRFILHRETSYYICGWLWQFFRWVCLTGPECHINFVSSTDSHPSMSIHIHFSKSFKIFITQSLLH